MFRFKFYLFFILTLGGFYFSETVMAMTVFSPIVEISVQPGETAQGIVKLYNEENQVVLLSSSVEAFGAGDETGQPIYLPKTQLGTFLDWFNVEQQELILNPRQIGIIPFSVAVPAGAIPGGYYGVIFWEGVNNPDSDKQVNISSRVGTLVFINVLGEVKRQSQFLDFGVDSNKIQTKFPVTFDLRIANEGNIHLSPQGTIELKTWFGSHDLEINQGNHYVLPNSIRNFQILWGQSNINFWEQLKFEFRSLSFGKVTATANLSFPEEDNIEDQTKVISFWFVPLKAIFCSIVFILSLFFIVRINYKINKLKKRVKKSIGKDLNEKK